MDILGNMSKLNLVSNIWHHPANQGKRLTTLLRSIVFVLRKRFVRRDFTFRFHNSLLLSHPSSKSSSSAVYFSGLPDYWEMQFLKSYLRPGDKVIDIGANVGLYTVYMAELVGKEGSVDAFEPSESTFALLAENLKANALSNVSAHKLACTNCNGRLGFESGDDHSLSHVIADTSEETKLHVEGVRLETYLHESSFSFAKLDIEGHEPFAIEGMGSWLERKIPPVFLIEMGGLSNQYGIRTDEFIARLNHMEYSIYTYDPVKNELVESVRHWERNEQNVLAIANDRVAEVKSRLTALRPHIGP